MTSIQYPRLIVIPTYNESGNIDALVARLVEAQLGADILFVDDSSPDGTADIIESLKAKYPFIHVMKRPAKLGIGSAQRDGILFGYQQGYSEVATMDADLTHAPSDLKRFFSQQDGDVIVGSRFQSPGSLPGWSLWRLLLTRAGHLMTRICLGIPYDATGALRVYRISRIPKRAFELAQSDSYAFIFESLFILGSNGFQIREVPIVLPGRITGQSKLRFSDLKQSIALLLLYFVIRCLLPERIRLVDLSTRGQPVKNSDDVATWDGYWGCRLSLTQTAYDVLAGFYRRLIIRPSFEKSIRENFPAGSRLLHAGCGSGQVDSRLLSQFRIMGLDHSARAIELYLASNGQISEAQIGSIFQIPFPDASFDGVYNLGVMSHLKPENIPAALKEFHRVLTPHGKIVLWWPPENGTSLVLLKRISGIVKRISGSTNRPLFPPEWSRIQNREQVKALLSEAGFALQQYQLSMRDLYTEVLVTATKQI